MGISSNGRTIGESVTAELCRSGDESSRVTKAPFHKLLGGTEENRARLKCTGALSFAKITVI
jgi:hypothetical protein